MKFAKLVVPSQNWDVDHQQGLGQALAMWGQVLGGGPAGGGAVAVVVYLLAINKGSPF